MRWAAIFAACSFGICLADEVAGVATDEFGVVSGVIVPACHVDVTEHPDVIRAVKISVATAGALCILLPTRFLSERLNRIAF